MRGPSGCRARQSNAWADKHPNRDGKKAHPLCDQACDGENPTRALLYNIALGSCVI